MNDEIKRLDGSEENPSLEECMDCGGQDELTPIEKWIQKSPQSRFREIEYLENARFQHQLQVTEAGDVQQVLIIDKWMFLMVIDKTFPKETENFEIPIKICLVAPNLSEYKKMINGKEVPCVERDPFGVDYIQIPDFQEEYKLYLNGQLDKLLAEAVLFHLGEWVKCMQLTIQKSKAKRTNKGLGIRVPLFFNREKSKHSDDDIGIDRHRAKYVDGRMNVTGNVNSLCKKVVLSNRAYIQIFNESQSRIQTETGGLLLGHFHNGIWYVIEASDPGINAKFYNAYHEGDDVYENHVCGVISRTYKYPLVFLGMWHRHPGSLDSFSGTDDRTNYKYAGSAGNGCISAIINYDPEFRITFYYVEQGDSQNVYYTKVDVEVGDDKIPNKELMKIASMEDVLQRLN